jgi:hypothetical protein
VLQVREEHILEVLCAADMYLLPGLKRGCGAVLGSCLSTANVVSRLKTARLFQLPHLEDQCTHFISVHIDKVAKYHCVFFFYLSMLHDSGVILHDGNIHVSRFNYRECSDQHESLLLLYNLEQYTSKMSSERLYT